ncbi:surface exclusion protein [Escherichia coli]|uniref:surface exclusion protein n=1 Tax=Escherichia coli TaxID=562 RepID=UPI00049ECE15|nr:surface exclusion protein [Escherichia coli]EYB64736.1 surface exclusion protein [Escherichia coli]
MRCLTHIALVTVIQFIACYLAGWGNDETIFMLFFIVLWRGLFIWLFSQIRKKRNVSDEFKFSKGVWYITMPVSSLLSPLLSLMVLIIGTLYELRRVSGCVSVREWMQSQVNEQTNEDLHLDFDNMDFPRTNPATGLPMSGIGVDIGGNLYGCSPNQYDE